MDGDGDRGYLVTAGDGGEALVVDGDAEALVIARQLRASGAVGDAEAGEYDYVASVESDLGVFGQARALGLATEMTAVGDKWLTAGFRKGRKFAVGEEVSGHVLWPVDAAGPDGIARPVVAGNGLLTALTALAASARLGLSPEALARPFPEGAFVTRHTYNVNKALFFAGSRAWEEDLAAISDALNGEKGGSFATWNLIENADEADMLYAGLYDAAGHQIGAVFARNSGTENKTGVYGRGEKPLEPLLERLCLVLWQMHGRTLKDTGSHEYLLEKAILKALEEGPLAGGDVVNRAAATVGGAVARETVDAVLFGMRKEGLVRFENGRVARVEA
jgi:phosphomannomutase